MKKREYRCRSVYKGESEQKIRQHLVEILGQYIRQQEEGRREGR